MGLVGRIRLLDQQKVLHRKNGYSISSHFLVIKKEINANRWQTGNINVMELSNNQCQFFLGRHQLLIKPIENPHLNNRFVRIKIK